MIDETCQMWFMFFKLNKNWVKQENNRENRETEACVISYRELESKQMTLVLDEWLWRINLEVC